MSSNNNGHKTKLNGRSSLYQHKPQRKFRARGLRIPQLRTVQTHSTNSHKPIEVETDIALSGLKLLRQNVHDPKTYGNGGIEHDILKTLSDFNEAMGIYFGTSHWGHIEQ
jgi:hypothetical protein